MTGPRTELELLRELRLLAVRARKAAEQGDVGRLRDLTSEIAAVEEATAARISDRHACPVCGLRFRHPGPRDEHLLRVHPLWQDA